MTMEIVWLPLALEDLNTFKTYYLEVASTAVARRQLRKITQSAKLLITQPYMGHISPNDVDGDVFEWHIPSTSYTLPYMVVGDQLWIMRVFDQRQKRPDSWH